MEPSSTGVRLGLPLLVIQPSSVLPSKSKIQPSSFSFSVKPLSAPAGEASKTAKSVLARIIQFTALSASCPSSSFSAATLALAFLQAVSFSRHIHEVVHSANGNLDDVFKVFAGGAIAGS